MKVAVLSDGFWQRRFGGDLAVIGSTLVVDGESHTIIGVMRAGFDPAFTRTEFWTPLNLRAVERAGTTFVQGVGVLRPGVTAAQAESEMAALFPPIQDEWPAILKRNWRNGVLDLREARYGSQGNAVLMLLAAVIGLALLAIANLANLTLADVMFRRSDFAVRAALGASRAEIAAPEVVQAVIVAVIGAAAGLGGASLLVPALFALDPSNAFTADAISIDWRVAIAAVAVGRGDHDRRRGRSGAAICGTEDRFGSHQRQPPRHRRPFVRAHASWCSSSCKPPWRWCCCRRVP